MSRSRLRPLRPLDAAERQFLALLPEAPGPCLLAPGDDVGWARVVDLAERHHVAEHLFARRDGDWWGACPAPARERLRRRYAQTSLHNAACLEELAGLLDDLRGHGVRPVLLKGAALLATVFGDPALRPLGDVDLLVRPEEIETAGAALAARGFVLDESFQTADFYRKHHFHLIWRHAARPWLCIEVHWDVALPIMDVRWNAEGLRREAQPATIAGAAALVPSPPELLLHLALHAALTSFALLGQIRDVAAVAAAAGDGLEPALLWRRAAAGRIERPLAGALSLAARVWPGRAVATLAAASPAAPPPLLLRALRPELVVRQRLRGSAAGGAVVSWLRRDGPAERIAWLARQARPTAALQGLRGHPPAGGREGPQGRLLQLTLPGRAWAYLALDLLGWEVLPAEEVD